MARPCKSGNVFLGKHGKEKLNARLKEEEKLKGSDVNLKPSKNLTKNQKAIFKFIVNMLKDTNVLGGIDIYVLERTCCCIDTIQQCENILNSQGLFDIAGNPHPAFKMKKEELSNFFRLINELSLSPQARAKIANLNVQFKREEDDLLLKELREDE